MTLRPIIFWGATGQARVLREFLASHRFELVALVDNARGVQSPFPGIQIYRGYEGFLQFLGHNHYSEQMYGIVAIGGAHGRARVAIQRRMQAAGVRIATLVHPTAFVPAHHVIGAGCQILAQSAICVDSQLGEGCIVNTRASVDHETVLGDGVHVGPGATLCGSVTVGEGAFIAAGATVLPRITIGAGAIVAAGAVVTSDVPAETVVVGCPARPHGVTSA